MSRINFVELPVGDLNKAKNFYRKAFGWEMADFGPRYSCTLSGDIDLGLQADRAEATTAPLPVIDVKNLEAALKQVIAAGGEIIKPISAFPGGRRFHFRDPSGNELAAAQVE